MTNLRYFTVAFRQRSIKNGNKKGLKNNNELKKIISVMQKTFCCVEKRFCNGYKFGRVVHKMLS